MTEAAGQPQNLTEDWNNKLKLAQEMLPLISKLHRENNAVTSIYGRILVGMTDIEIIKAHRLSLIHI